MRINSLPIGKTFAKLGLNGLSNGPNFEEYPRLFETVNHDDAIGLFWRAGRISGMALAPNPGIAELLLFRLRMA